jgi:beta-lactamase superfamily II metal-dependent hydrolase
MLCRLALTTLAALITLTAGLAQAGKEDGKLDIYFVDVEGGAATLIVTSEGESILIDSGYPDFGGRDRDRIVKVAKEEAKIEQIDHAMVSHWHLDHYGNHATLTEKIKIGTFWDRGVPDDLQEDKRFEERIGGYRKASQNESKAVKAGDMLPLKSGKTPLSVRIVAASREVIPNRGEANPFAGEHKAMPEDKSDNAASVSSLWQFGSFRFLTCGDLTWNVEAKLMMPNNPIGKVDVFMVTHHGLPSSNNPVLVKAIDPIVAVMCNGPTKGGAASTQKTLREVESLKRLYQLHRNVKLGPKEQTPAKFIANSGPTNDCDGVFVKLSVAADGKSYTVQIGADGKPRKFKTRG